MTPSTPIKVSIYALPPNSKVNELAVEYNFYTTEKLAWSNLVHFIEVNNISTEGSPITTLYYQLDQEIRSLDSQEQLECLLATDNKIQGIRFYGQQKLVKQPIFHFSSSPSPQPTKLISPFSKLGQITDKHKKTISSSHELSRCVGILASAIAMDTQGRDFTKEFNALEKVIDARKEDFESISPVVSKEEDAERTLADEPPLDNPFAELGHPATRGSRNRRGGLEIRFDGRGNFFGGSHRGRRHHPSGIFGNHSHHHHHEEHHNPSGNFGHFHYSGGDFGHHHHRGDFGHRHHRGEDSRHHYNRDVFEEGHHHHGGPADFFAAILATDEERLDLGKNRKHRKARKGRRDDERSDGSELSALQFQLFNTHIDDSSSNHKKRGGKGSK